MTPRLKRPNGRAYFIPLALTVMAALIIAGWSFYSGAMPQWKGLQLNDTRIVSFARPVGPWWYVPVAGIWVALFFLLSRRKGVDKEEFSVGAWIGAMPSLMVGLVVLMLNDDYGLFTGLKMGSFPGALFGLLAGLTIAARGCKIAGTMLGISFACSLVLATAMSLVNEKTTQLMGQFEGGSVGLLIGFAGGYAVGLCLMAIPPVEQAVRKVTA